MRLQYQKKANEVLSLSELIIDEEYCINLRGRMTLCTNCSDTCPSDALTLTIDSIELDSEKCTGCNSCLPSCAAGALRSSGFIPERFISILKDQNEVHLHCRGSTDSGGGVVIPCHSVLDSRLFLAAKGEGIEALHLHGLNNCKDCSLGDARNHIENVIQETRNWLGGGAPSIDTSSENIVNGDNERHYQDQQHLDRRSFLRFGGAKAIDKTAKWFVPGLMLDEEDDEEILPFYQADEFPQRPSQYAQVLIERLDKISWASDEFPWQIRRVNERCSGCLCCGERCPTGALFARETNEKRELWFDPALCTDCNLCERICPETSIETSMVKNLESVTTGRTLLFHLQQTICQGCGSPFLLDETSSKFCLVCSNEQDLDDEWLDILSD